MISRNISSYSIRSSRPGYARSPSLLESLLLSAAFESCSATSLTMGGSLVLPENTPGGPPSNESSDDDFACLFSDASGGMRPRFDATSAGSFLGSKYLTCSVAGVVCFAGVDSLSESESPELLDLDLGCWSYSFCGTAATGIAVVTTGF
jgi:hypothetical protein